MSRRSCFRSFAVVLAWMAALVTAGAAAEPPRRIASLNLTADEVLVEMLAPERLVGVTRFIDDPETSDAAGLAPRAAVRFPKADLERLVALAPDLVVVSEYTDADVLKALERSGLRVHRMMGLGSPAGIRSAILGLGVSVGEADEARRLVARYDATLRELARRLAGAPRPRLLYWANPHTAGGDTAIGSLIETAGAVNVGRELGLVGIVPMGAERAFVANPDVVLVGRGFGTRAALVDHPLLGQLRAVREGRVLEVPTPKLVTLSHRFAEACWYLAHLLHPDRVPATAP